ncbi:MAG: hypothetical protein JST19_08290 [Bacteroidetes bacterium]|nr:hypothetical protein [Bacteroidota bacterium]
MAIRPQAKAAKPFATASKKEDFVTRFAEIVEHNEKLNCRYSIQFFDTPATSNYGFTGLDGKSINVTQFLTDSEMDAYRALKVQWYNG